MILTKKQDEGLRTAVERYRAGELYTCIGGYAGSGKSTLIKFIISALEVDPEEDVCYVAFTGKAATVLQQKGCPNAITAHKLLYKASQMPNGGYKFEPRPNIKYPIVVVDEISMLPKTMWKLLLSHHPYVIAAGDPGQLPPIDEDEDNHVLDHPHVFLDEIMRQAQDSEIIRLSMWIRNGNSLDTYRGTNDQVQIYANNQITAGMYQWADQVICARNDTRTMINNVVRTQKGYPSNRPAIGDKVIGLHNNWDIVSTNGDALTNGTIGIIDNYKVQTAYFPRWLISQPIQYMWTDIHVDDISNQFTNLGIDYKQLLTGQQTLTGPQIYRMKKNSEQVRLDPPLDFAYAYAITCWKAQGSEYDKVLGFEESYPSDKETHKRYLYTLITRAKEKLVLIKK